MKKLVVITLMLIATTSFGQVKKVSLQASGLTCSMCSKAVKLALEKVEFVDKVQVDIKNQQYNLSFKENSGVDFDVLNKAVEDAGFSVASLKITADLNSIKLQKDEHVKIGSHYFHFLNGNDQTLNGTVSFSLVDKGFVTAKEFKKYSAMTKMPCIQTGRMANCCPSEKSLNDTRIYHVVI